MFKLPNEIIEGIKDYKQALLDFLGGKISQARFTGVRVPWGIYSHRGRKVFMSRIRIPAGIITPVQLEAIAYLAKAYGNGTAHITTRQDIQVHGIKIEDTIKVIEYLKDYELSPRGGGGNTVRNITACVLSGVCKEEAFNAGSRVMALSEYLLRQETSYNLPRKFKIALSGCGRDCAGCLVNDLGFVAVLENQKAGFRVFAGGGLGLASRLGQLLEGFLPEEDLAYCVEAVKRVFYKYGDRKNKHHNRLRFLLQDLGFEKFKQLYQKEIKELREKEYIALRNTDFPEKKEGASGALKPGEGQYSEFLKYSLTPQRQKGFSVVKLRIPRGDLASEELFSLAALGGDFPGIEFRTSSNQDLFIAWVKNEDLYKLFLRLKDILKEFLYPETLLDVVACKGALTCNLGLCNSPGLASAIEDLIKEEFIGKKAFRKLEIRLNGCPNSCAEAPVGKIGFYSLVKRVDNRPVPFYKLVIAGKKAAEDSKLAEEIGVIPARNIPGFLRKFLRLSEGLIDEEKDIYEFLDGKAKEIARETLKDFAYVPAYSEDRNFYIDWGKTEDFSLAGLGPGECGAGAMDMIESDLTEAKISLQEAGKDYQAPLVRRALFLASRALLVIRGVDPRSEQEAIDSFKQKFIDEQIASQAYADIREVFNNITDEASLEARKEKFLYAESFLGHINQLYKSMDSAFNFPQIKKPEQEKKEPPAYLLDLKGTPCPLNYVKAKLFLENLNPGDTLEVLLDEGEPINNVPKSLEGDGHKILNIEKQDGFFKVVVIKQGA